MDKLKPVLAHKFWIFFGIVLILPLVGYFMTKGGLAKEIEDRRTSLNTTFTGIPAGVDSANDQWIAQGKLANEKLELHNRQANKALWDVQYAKMRWPKDVAPIMRGAEYFKPVPPEKGGSKAADKYQDAYPEELRRLWEIVDPLDDGQNQRDSNKRRKISFAMASLQQVNYAKWVDLPPTFEEIWPCQEDIWLQTELLNAVARVNANAQSITDAYIKQLGKITLFGGTTQKDPGAGSSAVGGMSSSGGNEGFGGAMSNPMGGMGGRQADAKLTSDIALAEEFIAEIEASGGLGANAGGMATFGSSVLGESSGSSSSTPGGGAPTAKSTVKRYLDDDETQKFKRRGFYIKLVMDHRKIPEFLAELMNSPFPVEIVRVHQVWFSDNNANSPLGGSSMATFSSSGGSSSSSSSGSSNPLGFAAAETDETSTAAGLGASGSSGPRSGALGAAGQTPSADPNLASVSILGIWTLYRPNAEAPVVETPSSPAGTPSDLAGAAAVNGSTETPRSEAAPTSESTTEEPTADTAPVKPDENGAPKESEEAPKSDKGSDDKPSTEPSEKSAVDPKPE